MRRPAEGPGCLRAARSIVALGVIMTCGAGSLAAQRRVAADTTPPPVTTSAVIPGLLIDQLPVDRVDDALLLVPGVNGDSTGLSLRGGDPADAAVYLDGIPISPGLRHINAALAALTAAPMSTVGTNAVSAAGVMTGPLAAQFGNTSSGVILLNTRGGDSTWQPSARYGTDNIGPNSLGFNRLQAHLGGPIGKLRVFMSGVLEGQKSAASGFDAEKSPLFVAAGVDTTVDADGLQVPIQNFAVYRGDCDQFSGSSNPGISDNFGADCHGVRIPNSAVSSYQWLGRADYPIGDNGRLGFVALGTQRQRRLFDYQNLYNNDQQFGERGATGVYGITWNQRFDRRRGGAVELNAFLSAQHERLISGPLTPTGALDTADPTGGFLISPLDFRWDFESFPIDDELLNNVLVNNTAGRISPYDLRSTSQYALIDQFRNNAYGLEGFSERGGPVGRLELIHEHRWVGGGSLGWDSGRNQHITVGGNFTNYSVDYYSYELTSQAFGSVYRQRPIQRALWVEDQVTGGA
ncbi:MAG TPA: Plug domain-containing protein, partial [Gemmatimonadales bacterium]|nr:Plug domain-containing protein [Gemmatimonadales bacterium]